MPALHARAMALCEDQCMTRCAQVTQLPGATPVSTPPASSTAAADEDVCATGAAAEDRNSNPPDALLQALKLRNMRSETAESGQGGFAAAAGSLSPNGSAAASAAINVVSAAGIQYYSLILYYFRGVILFDMSSFVNTFVLRLLKFSPYIALRI